MTVIYEKLISETEALLQLYISNHRILSSTTQAANLHGVLEALASLRRSRDIGTATNVVNKVNNIIYIKYKFIKMLWLHTNIILSF